MKVNKTIYHLAFWLIAYLFWVYIFRNSTLVVTRAITIQFCYLIFIAGNYYFNTQYNIPFLFNKKRYVAFGLFFFTGIILASFLRVPVSFFVNTYIFKLSNFKFNFFEIFSNSFVNIFFWVAIILTGKMFADKIRAQLYIEQIEKEKAANELNFLRAQFNPHFLFNSINSIYGYIDKSNKTARNMLLVFSEMLRYQLYECNVDFIDIAREINYIHNYIEIQKSRIDDRIQVSFITNVIPGNIKIAPLIFITFIENAFKYVGFCESKENKVEITLTYTKQTLHFRIFNTKDSFINHADSSSGLGIGNARRRLELIYPNRHQLVLNNQEQTYEAVLMIENI